MSSIFQFDQWKNGSNTLLGAVINTYSYTLTSQSTINQSGAASENRGSTWYDSGLSLTLTPVSTSSRFLIFGRLCVGTSSNDSYNIHWRMTRSGTAIGSGVNGIYTWNCMGQVRQWSTAAAFHVPFHYLDSPATTSSLTYKIQVLQTWNAYPVYINRSSEAVWQSSDASIITILEFQG